MSKEKEVTFEKLEDAIKFVEQAGEKAQASGQAFANSFQELTGFHPRHQVTALDVVKICHSLYGEPKGD